MAVTTDQVISIANVLVPSILGFIQEHRAANAGTIPTVEEVNAHIAQHADAVVEDIERMQREHPRQIDAKHL
jgi:hypothetical protein